MKVMRSVVTIGDMVFENQINSVEIYSSWKNLTQTATIKIPRFEQLLDPNKSEYKIKVKQPVKIELGYDDELVTEYEGYVSEVSPMIPIEVRCEDESYMLKETEVTQSWRSIELKDLLKYLVPDVELTDVPAVTLAPFRLNSVSKFQALQKLKDEYLLTIYFRGKKMFAGFPYYEKGVEDVVFDFQENVPMADALKLDYKLAEDVKVKVKAVSMMPDNTKIEVEVGDDGGDCVTKHFYNIRDTAELNRLAKQAIQELKYDGYRGSLTTFGFPQSTHTAIAILRNKRQPERDGKYFIDGVKVTYGSGGYRRENELGRKASA